MRLVEKLINEADQTTSLRVALLALSSTCLVLVIALLGAVDKEPIIVQSGNETLILSKKEGASLSNEEIRNFAVKALRQRFDTHAVTENDLLSTDQQSLKHKEQKIIAGKNMEQFILANPDDIKIEDSKVVANVDRLIRVGDVRSAFRFPVMIGFVKVKRTYSNPYGLILTEVTEVPKEKE